MFIIHSLPTHPFRDEKIQIFVRSVRINRPLVLKSKSIYTEQILLDISSVTETLEFSQFLFQYIFWHFSHF